MTPNSILLLLRAFKYDVHERVGNAVPQPNELTQELSTMLMPHYNVTADVRHLVACVFGGAIRGNVGIAGMTLPGAPLIYESRLHSALWLQPQRDPGLELPVLQGQKRSLPQLQDAGGIDVRWTVTCSSSITRRTARPLSAPRHAPYSRLEWENALCDRTALGAAAQHAQRIGDTDDGRG